MSINPTLLQLARTKVAESLQMQKSAVVPPPPPAGDPSMMGGAPPMDPAMMGGAPPMDPSMMGAAPPMDPAMMGGAPPSAGAAPMAPPDPAAGAAMPPAAPAAPGMPAAPPKMKPEDRINQVDFRLYNMQQQLTAIMNALNVSLPAGALVTPPGSPVPVAEAAVPGGTQDPSVAGGQQGGQDNGTGINPIEALQAFNPGGGGGGGGGAEKQAMDIAALLGNIVGRGISTDILKTAEEFPVQTAYPQPPAAPTPAAQMRNNIAATAAILRSRTQRT